ncbi:MAG: hypothetical protein R3236_00175, partial [Phycisphaeraceae bacterium]|nr:hypothetical protein [Phycisphaeraceae bacterium]
MQSMFSANRVVMQLNIAMLCLASVSGVGLAADRFREGEKLENGVFHTYAEVVFDDKSAMMRWQRVNPQFNGLEVARRVAENGNTQWYVRIPKTVTLHDSASESVWYENGYRYERLGRIYDRREEAEAAAAAMKRGEPVLPKQGSHRFVKLEKRLTNDWRLIAENKQDLVAQQHDRMRTVAWGHRYLIQRTVGDARWVGSYGRTAFRPQEPYSKGWAMVGRKSNAMYAHPDGGSSVVVGVANNDLQNLRHHCLTRMAFLKRWSTLEFAEGNAVLGRGVDVFGRPSA